MRTMIRRSVLLPGLFLVISGCGGYREVVVKGITDVQVTRLDATGVRARVTVTLDNPNPYRIQVIDPDVDLYLNGIHLGKARLDSILVLGKRSTRDHTIPIRADFSGNTAQAMGVLMSAALTGRATLRAKGTVAGRAFLLRRRFPFEEERSFSFGD